MRRTIFDLFAKSPFGPLQDHMRKVIECTRLVPELFRAMEDKEEDRFNELVDLIKRTEHEADIIKNQIRGDLPKTIFTPVDRNDLLDILRFQDRISDVAEDVAVLLSMRRLPFPEEMRRQFWDFLEQVMATVEQFGRINEELDELMEASFGGAEAGKVMEMIDNLGHEEHKADVKQYDLVKKLLSLEEEIGPVNVILWMKVLEAVGNIANGAEKTGNRIRMFLYR